MKAAKIFFLPFLFSTFVISGPSTSSVSVGLMLAGNFNPGGKEVSDGTQCLTDTFTITNQVTVPMICGTNSGYHGKFEDEFKEKFYQKKLRIVKKKC